MAIFQVIRVEVNNVMSGINQQKGVASNVLDTIKSYIPKVQAAWIGGDADEFAADVNRKIVPAMIELIAAIGGVNLNLTKAVNIVDNCEKKCRSLVGGLADEFGAI
jgi:uncharacterized protein YukE